MNLSRLAPIALCAVLVACSPSAPEAPVRAAEASASADAASDTVAVYGDEAPVAIKGEADGDHAHNADGSHAEGEEHAQAAEGGQRAKAEAEAEAEAEHAHEPGQAAHDH